MTGFDLTYDGISEFCLFAGTETGQIIRISTSQQATPKPLIQAHYGQVEVMYGNAERMELVSLGQDNLIKLWSLSVFSAQNDSKGFENMHVKIQLAITPITTIDISPGVPNLMKVFFCDDYVDIVLTTLTHNLQIWRYAYGKGTSSPSDL